MRVSRSKMVASVDPPGREQRAAALDDAGYNVFNLPSSAVAVDLLTDSGTGGMSDEQWAALHRGDEAYAGSRSFERLREAVRDVMGFERVVPAHQGRGAENVLYGCLLDDGDYALNNTHFDTTRAHVSNQGATPVDCPVDGAMDPDDEQAFAGNFSVDAAREVVAEVGAESVPVVVLTVTNNSMAGQPVSLANTRAVRAFADEIDATFVIDACRFAENAQFVREREAPDRPVADIAREQLGLADALVMSGKKDGLVNVGGFVALRGGETAGRERGGGPGGDATLGGGLDPDALFERVKQRAILYEGFPTYGGMAGRDMEALAVGLREAVTPAYVEERLRRVRSLGDLLADRGVPVYRPVGGHAVYLDAGSALPGIPPAEFPAQALTCQLYLEGGVRGVELGSLAFPDADRPEFVRLAVPRRTYDREAFAHVADTARAVLDRRDGISGLEIVAEPETSELRHFSAELRPVEAAEAVE